MSAAIAEPIGVPTGDPQAWGERVAAAYRDIGACTMRELPIYHDALAVEAVGFQWLAGRIVGIIITPWFMNIVTPADEVAAHRPGSELHVRFPAGSFTFTTSRIEPIGILASCSLFSPMFEFADMDTARVAAQAAMAGLMAEDEDGCAGGVDGTRAIDRRAFLRGALTERPA